MSTTTSDLIRAYNAATDPAQARRIYDLITDRAIDCDRVALNWFAGRWEQAQAETTTDRAAWFDLDH